MSLAMYAAPIDNNENNQHTNSNYKNENPVARRRASNNKTQKMYPKERSNKVSSIMQTIHNLPPDNDDNDSGMGSFSPLPPPTSAGVENTKYKENFSEHRQPVADYSEQNEYVSQYADNGHSNAMAPIEHENETYNRSTPNYEKMYQTSSQNKQYYQSGPNSSHVGYGSENVLLEKLNYMVNLLEQQQDERTNNVTEEVILYSFLGIFIIFLVDSFVRVGKYVR